MIGQFHPCRGVPDFVKQNVKVARSAGQVVTAAAWAVSICTGFYVPSRFGVNKHYIDGIACVLTLAKSASRQRLLKFLWKQAILEPNRGVSRQDVRPSHNRGR